MQQGFRQGGQNERPGLVVESPRQAQIDADFQASGLGLTKEQVKAERKKLGIGTSFPAKLAFNKGLSTERTIEIHNNYAKKIFTEAYGTDDPDITALAKAYISELPKAARKGQERDFIAACEQKLEAFRNAVQNHKLGVNQQILDENAQARHEEGENAADLRSEDVKQTVVRTGKKTTQDVNANTNKVVGEATQNINANTNRAVNSAVKRINAHTTNEVNRGVGEVNAHTTKEVNRGVGEVNAHTTKEHNATRLQNQQQAVLDAKRQTMTDMLVNEVGQVGGTYRDSTVKWLGSAADRIMAATDLTFSEKKAALDELTRMIDEENVISDGDKNEFEARYFYRTEERPHI